MFENICIVICMVCQVRSVRINNVSSRCNAYHRLSQRPLFMLRVHIPLQRKVRTFFSINVSGVENQNTLIVLKIK